MLKHLLLGSPASVPCFEPCASRRIRAHFARLKGIMSISRACMIKTSCLLRALGGIHPLCLGIRYTFAIASQPSLLFFRLPQLINTRIHTAELKKEVYLMYLLAVLPSVHARCVHIRMDKALHRVLLRIACSAETERPISSSIPDLWRKEEQLSS
jgi:hypothetical protein